MIMMSPPKDPKWLDFYLNQASGDVVNLQMERLNQLFSHQVSESDLISNLKENPGGFMLATDPFNKVMVLHQVSILGPSLFQPEQYILALHGAGERAHCYRIHPSSFESVIDEVQCPSWSNLKGASSKEEILALTVPQDTAVKFRSRWLIVVPPLVAVTIMACSSDDAEDLIPHLVDTFKSFDQNSESVKACTTLRYVIFYLWCVTKQNIPTGRMIADSSSVGSTWSSNLHMTCIAPAEIISASGVQRSTVSSLSNDTNQIKAFSEISEILATMRADVDRSKLKNLDDDDDEKIDEVAGWKNIPPLLQNMIIRASSISDEAFPTGPCNMLLQVLRSKKIISIRTIMNVLLSSINCNVNVSVSLATAIASANLRSISPQVPHPFSCFNTPYHDASQVNSETDIKMQLMASDGAGVDKATAELLAKECYKIPYSTHKLRHQLSNWQGLLQLVFGPQALVTKEATKWVTHIDRLETTYDEQFKIDRDFGAKLCGLVDRSMYQFLGSCLHATKPSEVDWELLSLDNKRQEIQQNCFSANKPAFLIATKKPEKDKDHEDDRDEKERGKKRLKKDKEPAHLGAMVTNTRKVPEWDCKANYHSIFTKQVNRKTPPFNTEGMSACNKWHCQGYCFAECARNATHKPFSDDTLKKNYGDWVKDLKKKAAEKP
jgi:hypothetical protein